MVHEKLSVKIASKKILKTQDTKEELKGKTKFFTY